MSADRPALLLSVYPLAVLSWLSWVLWGLLQCPQLHHAATFRAIADTAIADMSKIDLILQIMSVFSCKVLHAVGGIEVCVHDSLVKPKCLKQLINEEVFKFVRKLGWQGMQCHCTLKKPAQHLLGMLNKCRMRTYG